MFGSTAGRRAVDTVSRVDFGLLAGLPFLPAPSTQERVLQAVAVTSGLDVQTVLGRRLVARGHVTPGHPVHVAAHHMKTSSRKAMQHSCITQEDRDGKAVRPFSPQDQTSKKPRIALAASSGTPVSPVTRRWAMLTRAILARDVLMVADKAWDCGQRPADLSDTGAHGALLRGERVPGRAPSPVPASQRDPDSAVAPAPRVPGDGPLPS